MPKNEINENLDYLAIIHSLFGNVKRARGYYLYTEKKCRLLDMFLCEGRAILGHKPKGVLTSYKRELDKGLIGAFPTKIYAELKSALKALFPQYESFICATKHDAISYLEELVNAKPKRLLFAFSSQKDVPIYKHGVKKDLDDVFLFLPYPSTSTTIILYKDIEDFKSFFNQYSEICILPAEQKAISSFIYALIAQNRREEEGVRIHSIKSKKALNSEKNTQKELKKMRPMLECFFEIEERYLYFKQDSNILYKDFFLFALKNGILLSPYIEVPSIFPQIQHYSQLIAFFKKL